MGHGYIPPDEQLFTPRKVREMRTGSIQTIQERLSLDALTMQEKEELKQAIDEVLYTVYTKWLKNKKARTDSVGL